MNESDKQNSLLPSGFTDLLPPDAQQEAAAINGLMGVFSAFGYERIKPPLVEFEESLLSSGPGAALSGETFRLMDPVSHRMMGVRSDMTPQTGRIATARLGHEPRPLRLAYAGDVLRTKASGRRIERQFGQAGCELIGVDSLEADIEVCVVAIKALSALGIADVSIDLCAPRLLGKLIADYGLEEEAEDIRAAVDHKDVSTLEAGKDKGRKTLAALVMAAGVPEKTLEALRGIDLPEDAKGDIERLIGVCEGVSKAIAELGLEGVRVTLDPLERKGFEYQSGIGFTLFATEVRGELGRGGRYGIDRGEGGQETAAGFTLYMDTVRTGMPRAQKKDKVFVSAAEGWDVIAKLQDEGWTVLRESGHDSAKAGASHIYKNGKVVKI